ncbi:MAG: phosphotransferase [Clostridia bacterium]|nr:phosphotransferase [Clostridia bacterium]
MFDYKLIPSTIKDYVKNLNYTKDNLGRSGDIVLNFDNKYILKISTKKEKLKREKEKNDWLINYIPVNKGICFTENKTHAFYLKSYLDGIPLSNDKFTNNPDLLLTLLTKALNLLSKVESKNCPFYSNDNIGNDFVHGDLCLPNILANDDEIIGFIDLENAGLGDKWYDYSWLLWSLSYNLETSSYNEKLLSKLKLTFNEEKYNLYIPEDYRK